MGLRNDESTEIAVFDAARYFSGYEIHGTFSRKHSIVGSQPILIKVLDQPPCESNFILHKSDQNKSSKAKDTCTGVRLSIFFNFLFHQLKRIDPLPHCSSSVRCITIGYKKQNSPYNSKGPQTAAELDHHTQLNSKRRKKHKQLAIPAVPVTSKLYPLSTKTSRSLIHYSQCNGFAGELWRDRRLDGIRVVGKKWVLNNSANDDGQYCSKVLLGDKGLSENKMKSEEDDEDSSSDASSDLFELENCN